MTQSSAMRDANPLQLLRSLRKHWHLLLIMSWRDVVGRYRGSLMGMVWTFVTPLLLLLIYTFVFTVVFKTKWNVETGEQGKATFAIVLFVGMIIHGLMAEILTRSPGLMLGNANYVKKVVFPLEILPLTLFLSAFFHFAVSVGVLLLAMIVLGHPLHLTILLLPLTLLPMVPMLLGIAWGFASIGVYLRDIGHLTGLISTVLLFLSPIFFPVEALGEPYQQLMALNPLTVIIEQSREVVLWGRLPDVSALAIYSVVSCLLGWFGLLLFQKGRKGFADVI
ncbi:ABC transporter permease [Kushneria sp. Sum13]|uniref:ABC transporter permease n=1 Tax=Kushneria sp. Sum13 TaxID=3459196 RepID=UPI0040460AD9